MQKHISTRGTELTAELDSRIEEVAAAVSAQTSGLALAKFVLEERETGKAVGVVLSWGEKQDTVVRHAEASDWERAFKDLERRLERALEESKADAP
jgi:ribosome-associated translation inhibitor RaiA